jgi:hypothetical protein
VTPDDQFTMGLLCTAILFVLAMLVHDALRLDR